MAPSEPALRECAAQVGYRLGARRLLLTTAESCTGGWIAKLVTDQAGSSAWFERGFVVYSNAAKVELLGVRETTLMECGAVSAETVGEMAQGALAHSRADLALAVSGVAGPGGGSAAKPVGTVWLAWMLKDNAVRVRHYRFDGDRDAVRAQAVYAALQGVLDVLAD